jgi:hypothetical protein
MSIGLMLREPAVGQYIPPRPFGVVSDGLPPHEIIRLLLGSVDVSEPGSGKVTFLTTNEFRNRTRRLRHPARISSFLFDNEVDLVDYERFVVALSAQNAHFFERLRGELALALVAKRAARYTESFLYFYRVLELTAVAFPLLYASAHSDFQRANDFLRSLMSTDKDGDLKVIAKAVPKIAERGGLSPVVFDFLVSGSDVRWIAELKRQIERCNINGIDGFEFESDGDVLFRVPFNSMPVLIATFRNRMFHYRVGEKNIELGLMGGSEGICKVLVPEISHWFALLYAEIIRTMAKRQL